MEKPLTKNIRHGEEPLNIKEYESRGGYQAVRKALTSMTPQEIIKLVKESNLRGRGGAGFPTGVKWGLMPMVDDLTRPRYLIANTDEMEPGTFKDRLLLEGDPHQLIEGIIISSFAVQT
jgi:NADH-quinone oxidoreductase subunit F